MKSYADDLPNADTVVRAIQDENMKVVATLATDIHNVSNMLRDEFTDIRTTQDANDARVDELIHQVRVMNEVQQTARKNATTFNTLLVLLQLGILASIIYHILGVV